MLSPLWYKEVKTAREVRSNLSTEMQCAIEEGHRSMNPAGPAVVGHFGNQRRLVRHQFLDCRDVGNALATMRDADVWWEVKCCLMFMVFTCVRSNEARMATWDEINFETATWTIPATRMKTGTEHRVPLSAQAMEVLVYARGQSDDTHGLIFPPQRGGQYMNSRMLSSLLHRLEIPCVPHGFRSSFGNWVGGLTHISVLEAQMVLALPPSAVGVASFMARDLFEQRRPIMQEWADFLTETMGPVIRKLRN